MHQTGSLAEHTCIRFYKVFLGPLFLFDKVPQKVLLGRIEIERNKMNVEIQGRAHKLPCFWIMQACAAAS